MHRTRLSLIVLLVTASLAAPAAHGASPDLVVSQVFAGGGNAGASFANDYVELFNRGSSTVDLTGWSIQYATATGTSWSPTALAGTLAPGRRYLVQFASAAAVGSPLPVPDASGTTNLATSGGKGGARARHSRAHLRRLCGGLLGGHDRPRPCRVRLRHGLRGRDHGSRPLQHHRGGSRRKRMHRHRLERRRLHRRDSHSPQLVDPCDSVWEQLVRRLPERAAG